MSSAEIKLKNNNKRFSIDGVDILRCKNFYRHYYLKFIMFTGEKYLILLAKAKVPLY